MPNPATRCIEQIEELADREAIRDCLYRYCRGIDRADEAMLRSAYWPDATDSHGAYNGSAEGFITQALQQLQAGGRGVHQISNCLIESHGALAAVESSFFALQTTARAPHKVTQLCGRYLDRFEKRNGEWRVAARTVVYDWIEEYEKPELAFDNHTLFGRRQPVGLRGVADPLTAFLADRRARAEQGKPE